MLWRPKTPKKSRMWEFMQFVAVAYNQSWPTPEYSVLYQWSIENPAAFWEAISKFFKINFSSPPTQILNRHECMLEAKWFSGSQFNFAQQLLNSRTNHLALISLNEKGKRETYTYQELYNAVAACAAGLRAAGVTVGDRVAAILPNVPYAIIAMLASASVGAIWSSCSPDFGSKALIDRLEQIKPKILFVGNGHQYLGKEYKAETKIQDIASVVSSLELLIICPIIDTMLHLALKQPTVEWDNFLKPTPICEFIQLPFDHPLYILFSSGTTGKPKCIVHGAGGTLLQHLKELALHTDIHSQDIFFFYTTCGWMMWNWMLSALALNATLAIYDGAPAYPKLNRLFHWIEEEKITVFGTSAKFISAVEKSALKPIKEFNLSSLRTILSTGSPLLPSNYDFVYQSIKPDVQLSSISGGTDIVSCFALGNPLLPIYRGELQSIGLGMSVDIFNKQGQSIRGERGELVCTKAFPSMPIGFWRDKDKALYKKAYFENFPGIWAHGDFAEITTHQGLIIYGRSDTTLNPGGVRIGTAEIYRQIENIPEISDSVVIGQNWENDVRIILFVKLKKGVTFDSSLLQTIKNNISRGASPRHVPAKIIQVPDIPRTMNEKTIELAVRQAVEGEEIKNLNSIINPESLVYFRNCNELNA